MLIGLFTYRLETLPHVINFQIDRRETQSVAIFERKVEVSQQVNCILIVRVVGGGEGRKGWMEHEKKNKEK